MLKAEITIERSPATVWKYFTNHKNWEKWWGGGMKSAQWRKGGELSWALGGSSKVIDIIPGQSVVIRGSWMVTKWEFEAIGSNTRIVVKSEPHSGASFSDGGASHLAEMRSSLRRLKQCVENETVNSDTTSRDVAGTSTQKRWWKFWK